MANITDLGIDGLTDYREIGSGGFAVTYSAYETDQDRQVAVKVLRAADEGAKRRFDRERRTMGTTTGHANIVTLFRSGYTPTGDQPYMVMEYLGGGSLQDGLERRERMSMANAIEVAADVASALGHSHSMGIVHKDVKPANILLSSSGAAKLTDFGIATIKESTATGSLSYSLAYTPPEAFDAAWDPATGQVVDRRDERSDLYSLAATLYALVTGVPPFDGPDLSVFRQIAEDPVPPTGHRALDRFLATAMAKDPDRRFPDAATFEAELRRVGQPEWATATVAPPGNRAPASAPAMPGPPPGPISVDRPLTGPSWPPPIDPGPTTADVDPAPHRRQRRLPLVAGLVAVVAIGFGALVVTRGDDGIDTAASTTSPSEDTTAPDNGTDDDTAPGRSTTIGEPEGSDDQGQVDGSSGDETTPTSNPTITPPSAPAAPLAYGGHRQPVTTMDQLPDGRLASGGPEGVLVWDPDRPGAQPIEFDQHPEVVLDLVALADGRIASAASDGVRVWSPDEPEETMGIHEGHPGAVLTVTALDDGRVASGGTDGVRIWHPDQPADTLATYDGHGGAVLDIVQLANGFVVSGGTDGAHIWHPDQPDRTLRTYDGHDGPILSLAALSDGRVASGSTDATVHLWDPDDPTWTQLTYSGHREGVATVVELSDRRMASAGADAEVHIWETTGAFTELSFTEHDDALYRLVALPGGWLASAGEDTVVRIWNPAQL